MGLDGVELVLEIEAEFGIHFAQDETPGIETVAQLIDAVQGKLASVKNVRPRHEVAARIRELTAIQMGLSPFEVSDQLTFKDLGY